MFEMVKKISIWSMTFVVFVMHEAKKKTMTKKICLIFKIFLVTSAQHLFLVCT